MKKFVFVMPLMAMSLLASCGGNTPAPEVKEHFVTFESKGGDHIPTQRVKDGETATKPNPAPTRDNDEFKGWFIDDGTYQQPYTFTEKVTGDITLYANWHEIEGTTFTVTFMNGDDEYDKIEGIEPKQKIVPPSSQPTKEHYNFIGWCTDTEGKNKFDFEKIEINQNYTLHAGYEKNCTITFKNNGVDHDSVEVVKGTAIPGTQFPSDPTDPPVPGQTFIGWGSDTSGQHIISDLATVKFYEETTILHANWTSAPIPVTTYTISFSCTNCKAYDETGHTEIVSSIDIPVVGSYITYCKFSFKGDGDYKAPLESYITVKKTGDVDVEFYYDGATGVITLPIIDNLTITANGVNKILEDFTWSEIKEISESGRAEEFFDIYDPERPELNCKKVQLKHQDTAKDGTDMISEGEWYQTVRIIGFNHDDLADGSGKAGITFEFSDLISDENGLSLATPWNWEDDDSSNNYNFIYSTLRKVLDGGSNPTAELSWYRARATEASKEEAYTKSVFGMLPNNLSSNGIIKEVNKPIAVYEQTSNAREYIVETDKYKTKLFAPSVRELSPVEYCPCEEGTTYEYYSDVTLEDYSKLIKWQVSRLEGAITEESDVPTITDKSWTALNAAGYNSLSYNFGGISWMRSPNTSEDNTSYTLDEKGRLLSADLAVYALILPVAPAFCI